MSFFAIYLISIFGTVESFRRTYEFVWESRQHQNNEIVEVVTTILNRFLYESSNISTYSSSFAHFHHHSPKDLYRYTYIIFAAFIFVVAFIAFQRHIMNSSLADYMEQAVQTTQVNSKVPTEPNVPKSNRVTEW
jgi:hypothetical protein